jgi:anti-anti-sigma factor
VSSILLSRRHVVHLTGSLTAASGDPLLDSLRSVFPAPAHVEVDLSAVTNMDRGGAMLLLDAYVAIALRAGVLELSGPTPNCRRVLAQTGVLDVIEVMDVCTTQPLKPRAVS